MQGNTVHVERHVPLSMYVCLSLYIYIMYDIDDEHEILVICVRTHTNKEAMSSVRKLCTAVFVSVSSLSLLHSLVLNMEIQVTYCAHTHTYVYSQYTCMLRAKADTECALWCVSVMRILMFTSGGETLQRLVLLSRRRRAEHTREVHNTPRAYCTPRMLDFRVRKITHECRDCFSAMTTTHTHTHTHMQIYATTITTTTTLSS